MPGSQPANARHPADQLAVHVERAFGSAGFGVELQKRLTLGRGSFGFAQVRGEARESSAGTAQAARGESAGCVGNRMPGRYGSRSAAPGDGFEALHDGDFQVRRSGAAAVSRRLFHVVQFALQQPAGFMLIMPAAIITIMFMVILFVMEKLGMVQHSTEYRLESKGQAVLFRVQVPLIVQEFEKR